jgi:hypothetical protein
MWYIFTMEFHSAIRNNETMLFEGKWMQLEDIMLSEVSQAQKDKGCHVFYHQWKIDPKDKHIHKISMITYKLICRTCFQSWNYSMELREGGKGKDNDRQQAISKYITSLQVEAKTICIENC